VFIGGSNMPSLSGLTILFAGSGAFGLPTLKRLIADGTTIASVYTQPDKPAGRGNRLTPTPIAAFARGAGLTTIATPDINAETLPPADLLVVIAFGQKLSQPVIDHARLGAVNLHASRLPKFRGAAPINWAIIRGEATTGNSVIRLAQKMDAGAVLAMSETPIGDLETAGELHDRLSTDGGDLLARVAQQLRDGAASPVEQLHDAATIAPKLSRERAVIDWTLEAQTIANQIRGMHPWPGCRVHLKDAAGVEVDRATLVRARWNEIIGAPGVIDTFGRVGCGTGSLEIVELQPDGKKPMTLAAYRNGKKWDEGMRLESIR
jgi:methionyl-tRNA formyltransferase